MVSLQDLHNSALLPSRISLFLDLAMPSDNQQTMPRTPKAQRFLSHLLKPLPPVLRKRTQGEASVPTMQDLPVPRPLCVALQNEDKETDAIVITALNVVPFCCHADLLAMDRLQLVTAAWTLNQKLPKALQIDVRPCLPDVVIRDAIEILVGIRTGDTPEPPDVIRAGPPRESPCSPLANKEKANARTINAALAALQEVDEDAPGDVLYRQRRLEEYILFGRSLTPSPPPGMKHSQSDHNVFISPRRRRPAPVLRTQSQKLPRQPRLRGPHPNITTVRGRTGSRTVLSGRSTNAAVMTSTPKKRKLTHAPDGNCLSVRQAAGASNAKAASTTPKSGRGPTKTLKRKLSELSMDETEDQVSFGIEGMTIPAAPTRMEVDPDDVYLY